MAARSRRLLCALLLLAASSHPLSASNVVVGRLVPYPLAPDDGDDARWRHEIVVPGASYVVVHFEHFELAPGERLTLEAPGGEPIFTLIGRGPRERGVEPGGFLAPAIPGDRVILELLRAGARRGRSFRIDRLATGLAASGKRAAAELAACGDDDSREARCSLLDEPPLYRASRAVARLLVGGTRRCTGWLFGDEGHLLTSRTCVTSQADADDLQVELVAEGARCTTDCRLPNGCPGRLVALGGTLEAADPQRDYALVRLDTSAVGGLNLPATYGFLQARCAGPELGETVFLPQHPNGWGRRIASQSSHPADGDGRPHLHPLSLAEVGHFGDTAPGSLGAPLVAQSDGLVVATDQALGAGTCSVGGTSPNRALRIDVLLAHLGDDLPRRGVFDPSGLDNDDFSLRATLPGASGQVTLETACSTREVGEPAHGFHSRWWRLVVPVSGPVHLSTAASDYDTTLAVYGGGNFAALELLAAADQPGGGEEVRFEAVAGVEYQIATASAVGTVTGTLRLSWSGEEADLASHLEPLPQGNDPLRRTLRARVANHGPGDAPSPRLRLELPPGLEPTGPLPCGIGEGFVTCLLPALAAGAEHSLDVELTAIEALAFAVVARADHATVFRRDPEPANDQASVSLGFLPDLAVAVRALASPAARLEPRQWVVTVTNTTSATFPDVGLAFTLEPSPWSFTVDPSPACTTDSTGGLCPLGQLAAGETRVFVVAADGPPTGTVALRAGATAGELASGISSLAISRAVTPPQVLRKPRPGPELNFGDSIAFDGDLLVVGGPDGTSHTAFRYQRFDGGPWIHCSDCVWTHPRAHFPGDAAARGNVVVLGSSDVASGWAKLSILQDSLASWPTFDLTRTLGQALVLSEDRLFAGHHPGKSVHIYEGPPRTWPSLVPKVLTSPSGSGAFEAYGDDLAVHGDRLLVSAHLTGPGSQGAAYLYERSGTGSWLLLKTFRVTGTTLFGSSVALTRDEAYVTTATRTYIYCSSLDWGACGQLPDGGAIRIDGDRLVLTLATASVDGRADAGRAVFYRRHSLTRVWSRTDELTEPTPTAGHRFGHKQALQGDTFVTGAIYADAHVGRAYSFDLAGPSVRVLSPRESGAPWLPEAGLRVRWSTGVTIRGGAGVEIDLVRDGRPPHLTGPDGRHWIRLRSATPDDGVEDVVIPEGMAAASDWRVVVRHLGSGAFAASELPASTVPDLEPADLSLLASGPEIAVAGTELAYSVTVENLGPGTARDVLVTWDRPAGIASFHPTGCPATGDDTCPLGHLPPGASATLTLSGRLAPDHRGPVTFRADALTLTETNPADNGATVATPVEAQADLALLIVPEPDPVLSGGLLVYRVIYENRGPSTAEDTVLHHRLGPSFLADPPSPCLPAGTQDLHCDLGRLAPGAFGGYSLAGLLLDGVAGPVHHEASVTSSTPDPVAGNDEASFEVQADDRPDLALAASDLADPVAVGQPTTLVLTAHNRGPVSAPLPRLEVTLPADATLVGVSPAGACLPFVGNPLTCLLPGLAVSENRTVTVNLAFASAGVKLTPVLLTSSAADARPGNEAVTVATRVVTQAEIFRNGFEAGTLAAWSVVVGGPP